MRKFFLMIITAAILLCGCGTKTTDTTEVKPTEIPTAEQSTTTVPEKSEESSQQGAETSEGEMMYSSMVYSTLDTEEKRIWVGNEAGIKEFRVPESFTNARGGIRAYFGFEMPELNRMAKEFEEKGGRIIGIVYDAVELDLVEEAKEIESDLKVSFMNLIPTDEIKNTLSVQSFPTTYFVNEKGELSGAPVVGSQVYAYRTRMTELLGEGQAE